MSLKITKDRSNIDVYSNQESIEESIEEFIGNLNKGLNSFDSLSTSANSAKDALHEWESSYNKYNNMMGDIVTIKDYKALFY